MTDLLDYLDTIEDLVHGDNNEDDVVELVRKARRQYLEERMYPPVVGIPYPAPLRVPTGTADSGSIISYITDDLTIGPQDTDITKITSS